MGGGPVGLSLAAELSNHQVNTILIETRPTTSDSPKAVSLSSRSMEHFRRLGLEEKIREASFPRELPVSMVFTTGLLKGKEVFTYKYASWGEVVDGVEGATLPFFQPGASVSVPILCPQYSSEAVIRKHLEDTSACVKMFWGWRVTSIEEDETGVTAKAVSEDGKEEKVFRARYLVGCDGGSSFVRKQLGVHMFGEFVVAKACTLTFRSRQLMEHMKRTNTSAFGFVLNPRTVSLVITLNREGDYAMHIILAPTTPDEEINWHARNPKQSVLLTLGMPTDSEDIPIDILYTSRYNMHALVSTKFGEGRCYLAGDSAHQWLPAGGLGLNTGIADVGNLSWKLAAMVKGYGGKHLLQSYEIERRPLADSTRRFAMSLGQNIALGPGATKRLRRLFTWSPLARFIFGKLMFRSLTAQFREGLDLVLGFQYSNSNIVMHQYNEDGRVRLHCNDEGLFTPASLPGCRAPHVVLPDSPSILDLFGKDFVLLIVGGAEADLKDLREVLSERGVPFSVHTYPPLPELTELYNRKYFLVRPDGVVAWRADYQPGTAESARIVGCVLGHAPPTRLPPPIMMYHKPGMPVAVSFARDLLLRASVVGLLCRYTSLPLWKAGLVGAGLFVLLRAIHVAPPTRESQSSSRHKAVVMDQYGSADSVLKIEPKYVGKFGPDDVLIRVHAASVTEADVSMRQGHGARTYQKLARGGEGGLYFPLILGRECSGEVVAVGCGVTQFLPGDEVYAAVPSHRQGAHAQLVAVPASLVSFKPSTVDHKEAASLPWAATTAWSALVRDAGLDRSNARGKKVLVLQGTGEVGSFAVQLLKAWGATVTTTCPVENTALAHYLGADKVVDDKTGDFSTILSGYNVVLDTVGGKTEPPSLSTLKRYSGAVYVSVASPREKLIDSLGGFLGELAFTSLYRCKVIFHRTFGGRGFYYTGTEPCVEALDEARVMVEQGAVRPLIDAVYPLDEVIAAHKHVEAGQTRGKVILSIP